MRASDLAVEDLEEAHDILQRVECEALLAVSDVDMKTAGAVDEAAKFRVEEIGRQDIRRLHRPAWPGRGSERQSSRRMGRSGQS